MLYSSCLAVYYILAAVVSLSTAKIVYPSVQRNDSIVETYFTVKVPNPYKWIALAGDKEKETFMANQTQTTRDYLKRIKQSVKKLIHKNMEMYEHENRLDFHSVATAGGKYFYHDFSANAIHVSVDGKKHKVLVSKPNFGFGMNSPTEHIINMMPSPSGEVVAYSVADLHHYHFPIRSDINFVNTTNNTDHVLPNVISQYGRRIPFCWTPDGTSIFYTRFHKNSSDTSETDENKVYIFLHTMGNKPTADKLFGEIPMSAKYFESLRVTDDAKFLVFTHSAVRVEGGILYYFKLCLEQDHKQCKIHEPSKISFHDEFAFLGNLVNTFYILLKLEDRSQQIVAIDITNPDKENWKVLVKAAAGAKSIWSATVLKGHSLVVAYQNKQSGSSIVKIYGLPKLKEISTIKVSHRRITALHPTLNDTKVVVLTTSPITMTEAFLLDIRKSEATFQKILLPQCSPDPFRDSLLILERNYSSHGVPLPLVIMHGKKVKIRGDAPTLIILGHSTTTFEDFRKLFVPFMQTFNGVVVFAQIQSYGTSCNPPTLGCIDNVRAAMQYMVKHNYTTAKLLTLAPGSNIENSLIGAVINEAPDMFKAALLLHPGNPSIYSYRAGEQKNLDLTSYFTSKENTKNYFRVSPIHNIKFPDGKAATYPAIYLADLGSLDAMKYIAELQHTIGKNPNQVNPLLAVFAFSWEHGEIKKLQEVHKFADCLEFLALVLD